MLLESNILFFVTQALFSGKFSGFLALSRINKNFIPNIYLFHHFISYFYPFQGQILIKPGNLQA